MLAMSPSTQFKIGSPGNIGWFILVLGAWGGASCWYIMAAGLKQALYPIFYVDTGFACLTYVVVGIFYRENIAYHGDLSELILFLAGFFIGSGTNLYQVIIRTYREASTIAPLTSLYVMMFDFNLPPLSRLTCVLVQ